MQPYLFKQQVINVGGHDYNIRDLLDRQQFNDDDHVAADLGICSGTWALFGVVWPSARVLANCISGMSLQGKKVLELGCGIGLASIVLHRMGVDITASDYHPLAREFLQHNVKSNNLSPIKYLTANWEEANPELGQFDLIIGSDVLYQPSHPAQLSRFIPAHCNTNASVLIVDPDRGNRNNFTRRMEALGFLHHFESFNTKGAEEDHCKGRILHYQRG